MTASTAGVMSWPSRALLWLIPNLLITAPVSRPIVLISPWIQNVMLKVPLCQGAKGSVGGDTTMTNLLTWLAKNHNKRFEFYVRTDQLNPTANYRLAPVIRACHDFAQFYGVQGLHGKMIVTDYVALETSANLLTASLHRNVETVMTRKNPDGDAAVFARHYFRTNNAVVSLGKAV